MLLNQSREFARIHSYPSGEVGSPEGPDFKYSHRMHKQTVLTAAAAVQMFHPSAGNLTVIGTLLPTHCTREDIVYACEECECEDWAEEIWCEACRGE